MLEANFVLFTFCELVSVTRIHASLRRSSALRRLEGLSFVSELSTATDPDVIGIPDNRVDL